MPLAQIADLVAFAAVAVWAVPALVAVLVLIVRR
jgi:hypothetical protein